jgi:membrane protease YdiL (CAAX protease family)
MESRLFQDDKINLPSNRPFDGRFLVIAVLLYFIGNLAGLPLLRATQAPIEPAWFWGLATLISAIVLSLSMLMASRSGLGAPLLENLLPVEARLPWLRTGLALTVLIILAGLPFGLWLNLQVDPATYPAGYLLVLASVKAGVVEELLYRFFMVSLLVWLAGFTFRSQENWQTRWRFWIAIGLSGLVFGWAHVDARLVIPGISPLFLTGVLILNSLLGTAFGWLFWTLGIEWAIFAHFAYDAVVSAVLLKVYLSHNLFLWLGFIGMLALGGWWAWRMLRSGCWQV